MSTAAESLRRLRIPTPNVLAAATSLLIPFVLVGAWALADAVQPPSYSAVRQTVSVAAGLGAHDRWIMTGGLFVVAAAYLVCGATFTALNPAGRIGLALAGLSAIGIAVSPEPEAGGGTLRHAVFTAVGAVVIAVWPTIAKAARPDQPPLLRPAARTAISVVSFGLLAWMAWQTRDGAMLGLAERVSATVQVCWPAVVALSLWFWSARRRRAATGLLPR